jgi:hypothetical protein
LHFHVTIVVVAAFYAVVGSAQPAATEDQVKAAYLMNFARFVEWPASVLAPAAPLEIVVIGNTPLGGILDQALRGKSANGHPIRVRHLAWNENPGGAHVVFISAEQEEHLIPILRTLANRSVLTVSDIERFSLRGGIIEFILVGDRLRFDINRAPATAARLTISSKLLSVARAVREGSSR